MSSPQHTKSNLLFQLKQHMFHKIEQMKGSRAIDSILFLCIVEGGEWVHQSIRSFLLKKKSIDLYNKFYGTKQTSSQQSPIPRLFFRRSSCPNFKTQCFDLMHSMTTDISIHSLLYTNKRTKNP